MADSSIRTGADVSNVAQAIGLDPRIGNRFLNAGLGFGGSCFKKDILSLAYLAESLDLPEVAEYWRQVISVNQWQCTRFIRSVVKTLNSSLRGKKIAVLGYAFKRDTADTRESQAAEAIRQLLRECPMEVSVYDPLCTRDTIESELREAVNNSSTSLTVYDNAYSACSGAAAVLVLTEWKQFSYPPVAPVPEAKQYQSLESSKTITESFVPEPQCIETCTKCERTGGTSTQALEESLDWSRVSEVMGSPKWVFDARGLIGPEIQKLGFRVNAIGKAGASNGRRRF